MKKKPKSKAALEREIRTLKDSLFKKQCELVKYRNYASSLFETATTLKDNESINKNHVIQKLYGIFKEYGCPEIFWKPAE